MRVKEGKGKEVEFLFSCLTSECALNVKQIEDT